MVWGPSNSSPTTSMTLASSTCSKYHADTVSCQKGVEALSVATGVTLTSPHHHLISPLPLLIPPHHHITSTMSTSHSTPSCPPCSKGHGHLTITLPSPHRYTTPTMLPSQHQNCVDHHLTTDYCPLPLPQTHVTSSPFHQTLQGLHHYSGWLESHNMLHQLTSENLLCFHYWLHPLPTISQDTCQGSLCALGRIETPADHAATV